MQKKKKKGYPYYIHDINIEHPLSDKLLLHVLLVLMTNRTMKMVVLIAMNILMLWKKLFFFINLLLVMVGEILKVLIITLSTPGKCSQKKILRKQPHSSKQMN